MSFFSELRRRNVIRVGAAYLAAIWVLIQVADTILPVVEAPGWVLRSLVFSAALGFPLAVALAWFYELTPEGLKPTDGTTTVEPAGFLNRRIDFAIIALLVMAVGFLVVANYGGSTNQRSVAALPFTNESAAAENAEFFANGMHDELLNQLAKISSLKVISRTSVMEYRGTPKNLRQIGRELGVTTLLQGSVQRAGNRVRISVQLIDAQTDEYLWTQSYNREVTTENIFAIQNEMATSIAAALQATLSPEEASRLGEVPTRNARAYDAFLTGKDYFSRADETQYIELGIEAYERAVEEDPQYALAWAALAQAHSEAYRFGADHSAARLRMAGDALARAERIAPDAPEVHLASAFYHYLGLSDYETALEEFDLAEQGMPGATEIFNGRAGMLRRAGNWEQSIADRDRAIELDPRNIDQLISQGTSYAMLRDYDKAEEIYARGLEIEPDSAYVYWVLNLVPLWRDGDVGKLQSAAEEPPFPLGQFRAEMGWTAAIFSRDYSTALRYLDAWDVNVFRRVPKELYYGETYALAGQPQAAERYLQQVRAKLEAAVEMSPEDHWSHIYLGQALARLGDRERAVRMGRRAMEIMPDSEDALEGQIVRAEVIIRVLLPAGAYDEAISELDAYLRAPGWWSIEGLMRDPRFDAIADEPRFQELVRRYQR